MKFPESLASVIPKSPYTNILKAYIPYGHVEQKGNIWQCSVVYRVATGIQITQTPHLVESLLQCVINALEVAMDRIVKARFFQTENVNIKDATFSDCLSQLWNHPNQNQYHEIFTGVHVRLERYANGQESHPYVEGEFVRQQQDNVPPVAPDASPLEEQEDPIGHRVAFCYRADLNVMLLESRREAVTPTRIEGLIRLRISQHKGFFISPVLSKTALDRLRTGTPRKIRMRVARPASMSSIEGDPLDIEDNLSRFQNLFGGPNIEVSSSFPRGDRDGALGHDAIRGLIRWATENRDHVERLTVKILEESDPIDVFSEQIKVKKELDLDNRDVGAHYESRRSFLRESYQDNLNVIQRIYQ